MAFTYIIENRVQLAPANKRKPAGPLYLLWGTFAGAAVTTGVIVTETETVRSAVANSVTAANAVQVELDTASAGEITLTFTSGESGTWMAICRDRK